MLPAKDPGKDRSPFARLCRRRGRARALLVLAACLSLALGGLALDRPGTREPLIGVRQPAVAGAPVLPDPPTVAADDLDLQAELRRIATEYPGRYGVAVYDPASGTEAYLRSGETFYAASIGKLPTLLALYRAADRGAVDLEATIEMLPSDVAAYGSGILHTMPPYTRFTLKQCAFYLVNKSDNTAWMMLDRYLGRAAVQAELETFGAHETDYARNTTTPRDVLLMLQKIEDPAFTSASLAQEMLDAMTDTAYEDRIPAGLPSGVRVAHKIGSYENSFSDAGIVFYRDADGVERRFFLVILSSETTEAVAEEAIRDMSATVYESLVRET